MFDCSIRVYRSPNVSEGRAHLLYKISGSDPDSALGSLALIMESGHDQSDEFSMLKA